jgi:Family of unknown function (DUF6011)
LVDKRENELLKVFLQRLLTKVYPMVRQENWRRDFRTQRHAPGDFAHSPQFPAIVALNEVLDRLSPRDRDFAISLQAQQATRPLTEKQMFWVGELTKRGRNAGTGIPTDAQRRGLTPAPETRAVVFSRIAELFAKAGQRAVVVFRTQDGTDFRLSVAGERSQHQGDINVTDAARSFENRQWFGRITSSGGWVSSRKVDPATLRSVEAALAEFNADPAKAAASYGHATGSCCFCSRELTDERSVSVGYGPICAAKFSLPWGEVPGPSETEHKLTCSIPF